MKLFAGRGTWDMGRGAWGVGRGAWGVGHGAWGMGHGAWGMGHGAWRWLIDPNSQSKIHASMHPKSPMPHRPTAHCPAPNS
ncbi:hypothetical protein [Kamptonema formosum]|uniref:hypothetical protein n=1 Tax=Kamptonema formosum TaxID=331992 RepID=UPI0018E290B7|nr:hypothetical protein [Oscillatoria sp. PCC 10802]